MIVLTAVSIMFLFVAGKLAYNYMLDKRTPRMDSSVSVTVRRDSTLIHDLEEFHLRRLHRLIIRLIQPRGNGPVVRNRFSKGRLISVSYTHLTLPTILLV